MKKIILHLFIFVLVVELIAWIAPHWIGKYVYQPLSSQQLKAYYPHLKKLVDIRYDFNENGARGRLFQGEPIRIAIVGESTAFGLQVDQEAYWGRLLEKKFCFPVHVESYGIGSTGEADIIELVDHWGRSGRTFDLVIAVHSFGGGSEHKAPIFRYTANFRSAWPVFKSVDLLGRYLKRNWLSNKSWSFVAKAWASTQSYPGAESIQQPVFNVDLRQNGPYEFEYVPYHISEKDKQRAEELLKEMQESVQKVAQLFMIAPSAVAYSDEMLPEILETYLILAPIGNGRFKNPKSFSEKILKRANFTMELIEGREIIGLRLQDVFEKELSRRVDLFVDEVHHSEEGSKLFAQAVYEKIKGPLIEQLKLKVEKGLYTGRTDNCSQ